jgi:hemolysin-activating ACP:hemolysin acyltransferase
MNKLEPGSVEKNLFRLMFLRTKNKLNTPPDLSEQLMFSAMRNKISFFGGAYGKDIGYVAWADICKESAKIIIKRKSARIYDYEYDEGKICFLIDIVFDRKESLTAKAQLKNFILEKKMVLYIKRNGVFCIYKNRLRRL